MITIRIVPDIIAKIIIISKIVNMVIITNMTGIDDEAVRNVLKVLFDKSLSPPLKLHQCTCFCTLHIVAIIILIIIVIIIVIIMKIIVIIVFNIIITLMVDVILGYHEKDEDEDPECTPERH